jgi:hypothetical protein
MGQANYGLDQTVLWYRRDGGRTVHEVQLLGLTNGQLERMTTTNTDGRLKPMLAVDGNALVTKNVPVQRQTSDALRRANASHVKDDPRILQLIRRIPGVDSRMGDASRIDAQWMLVDKVLDELDAADKASGIRLVLATCPPSEI